MVYFWFGSYRQKFEPNLAHFPFCHQHFFGLKIPFFHLMPSPKFLKILQRIGLNHGKAHVKLFQWYIFGLGAIGKSLSLIWPIFHFPIIFLIILSHNLFSNVHVHMCIFSLTHGRLQLTLWVKFWFPYDLFGLVAPSEKITPIMGKTLGVIRGITPIYWGWLLEEYLV